MEEVRNKAKIYIVEDDEGIREELQKLLSNNGFEARYLTDFTEAANVILQDRPDLVLLDVNLPDISGFSICDQIRSQSNLPIIFVTSNQTSMDELNGLMRGGDDYITKPYQIPILLARINMVLRRTRLSTQNVTAHVIEHHGIELDLTTAQVNYQGKYMDLTKNELKILSYLLEHKERIVSRTELIDFLWDNEIFIDDNTLSVNITRIRTKLETIDVNQLIETKRGMGYKIM